MSQYTDYKNPFILLNTDTLREQRAKSNEMNIRRNLLTGVTTVVPILVTIFVVGFFVELLSDIGRPKVVVLANAVRPVSPELATWLLDAPWFSSVLAIGLTVGMLYLLGWSMTRLIGRQMLLAIEYGLKRIPLVTTVYGATKKLMDVFQAEGDQAKKVVLIEFPHARMKTVGLVTRNFVDEDTGEELAAVYVPTAPNPAGGYLEIVRVDELVPLDWTVDQVMAFVISGGTVVPNERIRFTRRMHDAPGGVPKFNPKALKPEAVDNALATPEQPISAQGRDT